MRRTFFLQNSIGMAGRLAQFLLILRICHPTEFCSIFLSVADDFALKFVVILSAGVQVSHQQRGDSADGRWQSAADRQLQMLQ
jgi:hypothetical protein